MEIEGLIELVKAIIIDVSLGSSGIILRCPSFLNLPSNQCDIIHQVLNILLLRKLNLYSMSFILIHTVGLSVNWLNLSHIQGILLKQISQLRVYLSLISFLSKEVLLLS
jgi:hypothetical protein